MVNDVFELLVRDAEFLERLLLGDVKRQTQLTGEALACHAELRGYLFRSHCYADVNWWRLSSCPLSNGADSDYHEPHHQCEGEPEALPAR